MTQYTLNIQIDQEYVYDEEVTRYYAQPRNYLNDSGLDVIVPKDIVCRIGSTTLVGLGIRTEMLNSDSESVGFFLAPRSSIYKSCFRLANSIGIIDAGYRGCLGLALDCVPYLVDQIKETDLQFVVDRYEGTVTIKKGTRLGQICHPSLLPFQSNIVLFLSQTERGDRGFGSTTSQELNVPAQKHIPSLKPFQMHK